ncbi:MAG: GIY-YIG nuclease family protein, partial [Saprospiraceae bacterium]|nr:GIY-YIG nuclease family protein [Saprospiraceae bacterium]
HPSKPPAGGFFIMATTYILYSPSKGRYYIGHTTGTMEERLRRHLSAQPRIHGSRERLGGGMDVRMADVRGSHQRGASDQEPEKPGND